MPLRAQEIADLLGGQLVGDPDLVIESVAKIEEACASDITFLANPKYEKFLATTQASAILLAPPQKVVGKTAIYVSDPYTSLARLLKLLYPEESPVELGIHPTAVLSPEISLGERLRIGAHVVIGSGCCLENDVTLYPHVTLGDRVRIGEGSVIRAGVSIRAGVQISRRVIIQDNAVIGSDGFGFAPQADGDYQKIPQVGTVIIEDDVEIGAGCTIDRATLGATRIGHGAKLDNLIQVAHNVVIGANTVIAAQTGISGSTQIGQGCMIGGQVGFAGHLKLGDRGQVGAQSGVSRDFPPDSKIFGYPAKPLGEELRVQAIVKKLPELYKTINQLEKKIEELAAKLYGK